MRTIGLDLGEKYLGVAVSDPKGQIAVPHSVINLTNNKKTDLEKLTSLITELGAEMVVVGFPLNLKSQVGTAAEKAQKFVETLKKKINIPVALYDERFSTVEANKSLKNTGLSTKKSRSKVDMVAASIILQAWLDKNSNE